MLKEQELLRQIFLWLSSRHRHAVADLSGMPLDIHTRVAERYDGFQDIELEKLLLGKDAFNCLDHRKFLLLEPVSHGTWMLPVLSFSYDFNRSHPEFRLRMALFLLEKLNGRDELRAIGYRFESPEGEGIHHYYHAQMIHSFEKHNEQWRIPCPGWLPTKQPAFALDANSPVTLVACILISLYGRDFISELQQARFWDQLKDFIQMLMSSHPSFQPTYWEVTFNKSKKFYKTWEKGRKFRQIMRTDEKVSEVKEISLREYIAQKESSRFVY
jgi:hypothetical protein